MTSLQEISEFRGNSITKSAVSDAIELMKLFNVDEVVTAGECAAGQGSGSFG